MRIGLTITLTKETGKRTILKCMREDGSSTFTKLYPNLEIHDIAHYVVEQHLGFRNAFYGLLAKGYTIEDFQLPKNDRPIALHPNNLHPEALITEHLVNLIQTHYNSPYPTHEIMISFQHILKENGLPFPKKLNADLWELIQKKVVHFMEEWLNLPNKGVLTMKFSIGNNDLS